MKRRLFLVMAALALFAGPAAADQKIKVGMSGGDAEIIWAKVKEIAAKDGLDVRVVVFNDYLLPNAALDAAQLPRSLDDVDAAVINTNYAVPASLIPGKDSIAIEPPVNNPYNNFIAVREKDKDAPWIAKLVRAYQNDTVRQHIKDKLPGQIPAF